MSYPNFMMEKAKGVVTHHGEKPRFPTVNRGANVAPPGIYTESPGFIPAPWLRTRHGRTSWVVRSR